MVVVERKGITIRNCTHVTSRGIYDRANYTALDSPSWLTACLLQILIETREVFDVPTGWMEFDNISLTFELWP